MLADLGQIYLILAFAVAILTAMAFTAGISRKSHLLISLGRYGIFLVTALYLLAIGILINAFINKDFDFEIIAQHTSLDLPVLYSFTALYASKSGSILFWGLLLSFLTAFLTIKKFTKYPQIMPFALAVMALVQAFFLLLVTLVTNVFEKSSHSLADGMGLNPQLQNIGMLIHPPILYFGFAGFTIVFAFMMGALFSRSPSREWTMAIRKWLLFAWCALGIGNLVGAWWAYNELDWGGYWAWDPVENAGFMPWLLGTALVHSVSLLRTRNYLKGWSFSLGIFTFLFVLLSPFITHGGIESLLHGFSDSPLPPYIMGAIIVTMAGSFWLLFIRRDMFHSEEKSTSLFSPKGAFLLTNILFVVVVLLMISGTVFPRMSEAFGQSVTLDREFFDQSCGPVLLFIVFFLGVCPLLRWKAIPFFTLLKQFLLPFGISLIAAICIMLSGIGNWYAVTMLVCGFALLSIILEWFIQTRNRRQSKNENYLRAFLMMVNNNRARSGGFIVHIGIVVLTIGIIGSSMYDTQKTQILQPGSTMNIRGYDLTYDELMVAHEESNVRVSASISVSCGDHHVTIMHPEKRYFFKRMQSSGESAIRTTLSHDLFVTMLDYDTETKSATIKAIVSPLIIWMWIGGGILLIGAVVAVWPERKKTVTRNVEIKGSNIES